MKNLKWLGKIIIIVILSLMVSLLTFLYINDNYINTENEVDKLHVSNATIAKFEFAGTDGYYFKLQNGDMIFTSNDDLEYDVTTKYDLLIVFDSDNEWEILYLEVLSNE